MWFIVLPVALWVRWVIRCGATSPTLITLCAPRCGGAENIKKIKRYNNEIVYVKKSKRVDGNSV
jgi:hypothetical protein